MKITLKQLVEEEKNGEKKIVEQEKVYEIPYVSSSAFLEYLEIEAEIADPYAPTPQEMKKLAALVVKTYKHQFTEEEFFEGVPSFRLMKTFNEFITGLNEDPYASKKVPEESGNAEKKAV